MRIGLVGRLERIGLRCRRGEQVSGGENLWNLGVKIGESGQHLLLGDGCGSQQLYQLIQQCTVRGSPVRSLSIARAE